MHYGDCQSRKWDVICGSGRDPFNQNFRKFRSKTHGSVRSNRKRFDITGPPFEVDHFSRSDRSKFWMNGLDRAHCDVSLPGLLHAFSDRDIARKLERANQKNGRRGRESGERGNFPFPTPSNILLFFPTEKCHVE